MCFECLRMFHVRKRYSVTFHALIKVPTLYFIPWNNSCVKNNNMSPSQPPPVYSPVPQPQSAQRGKAQRKNNTPPRVLESTRLWLNPITPCYSHAHFPSVLISSLSFQSIPTCPHIDQKSRRALLQSMSPASPTGIAKGDWV